MTHGGPVHPLKMPMPVRQERCLPQCKCAMLLEGCHTAEDPVIFEVREPPLDGFLNIRTGSVDDAPQVAEDGPGEWCRPGNIGIDAGIFGSHGGSGGDEADDQGLRVYVASTKMDQADPSGDTSMR